MVHGTSRHRLTLSMEPVHTTITLEPVLVRLHGLCTGRARELVLRTGVLFNISTPKSSSSPITRRRSAMYTPAACKGDVNRRQRLERGHHGSNLGRLGLHHTSNRKGRCERCRLETRRVKRIPKLDEQDLHMPPHWQITIRSG